MPFPKLVKQKNHTIEAVVDRIIVRENMRTRLADSIQLALKHSEGLVGLALLLPEQPPGEWRDRIFSTEYACPNCKLSYEELQPRTFSFNSPYGACPECDGLGAKHSFDPDLVLPDRRLSISAGAIAPCATAGALPIRPNASKSLRLPAGPDFRLGTPLAKLKPKALQALLDGDRDGFPGLLALLEREYEAAETFEARDSLESYRGAVPCPACGGARLRPEARAFCSRGGRSRTIVALTVEQAREFFAGLEFRADLRPIATPLLHEIMSRLEFLDKVGLPYLTLNRSADSLSGGELQRIRLATGIGSGLVGVCYVLDEPSIGLHPRDNGRLIEALRDLQQQGNTVLVVEHDEAVMRQADQLIDIGPGAGAHGGRIVAQGTPEEIARDPQSLTGRYLSGELSIPRVEQRRTVNSKRSDHVGRRDDQQSEECRSHVSAVGADLRDRGQRFGQKLAVQRDAGPGLDASRWAVRPEAWPFAAHSRHAAHRQVRQRSIRRRSAARRAATPQPTPECSTRSARSLPRLASRG